MFPDELHTDLVNQTALLKSSSMEMLTTEETDSVDFATGKTLIDVITRMTPTGRILICHQQNDTDR